MQAGVQQGAGAGQPAAAHEGDDVGILDQLALGVAAADAHDLGENRRERLHAAA